MKAYTIVARTPAHGRGRSLVLRRFAPMALAVLSLAACSGGERAPVPAGRSEAPSAARRPDSGTAAGAPAAIVVGEPVSWETLRPILAEIGGGQALEEVALDRRLERACRDAGVTISQEDIEAERQLLARSLGMVAGDPDTAARLIEQVRRARGLGEVRFGALLRRNAMLRALVRPEVDVSEELILQTWQVRYGEKISARIITVPTLDEARRVNDRLAAGEPFGEVATSLSTDVSAARAGIIEPISPADPSYPVAIRSALQQTQPGGVTPPIALDSGYAILKREATAPAAPGPSLAEVRPEMEREARLGAERVRMDALARTMLDSAGVTILDRSLDSSWKARRRPQ